MEIALAVPDTVGRIEKRILTRLASEAEEWGLCVDALSKWEDEHLLDKPSQELLAEHKNTVEHLLRVGQMLSLATTHPDFPDRATAEMVDASQEALKFKLQMWHKPRMAKEQSDQILAKVFPDES